MHPHDDGLSGDFEDTAPGFFRSLDAPQSAGRDGAQIVWAIRCATRMVEVRHDLDFARAHGVALALCADGELCHCPPELVAEAMVRDVSLPG
jgi:hypothetical protein